VNPTRATILSQAQPPTLSNFRRNNLNLIIALKLLLRYNGVMFNSGLRKIMLRSILLGAAALAAVSLGSAAQATQFVTNGSFETTSLAASYKMNTTNVTGWSTTGYNFLFFPGAATTTGAYVPEYKSQITLWGGNGFPASSPDGGNFIAADGAFGILITHHPQPKLPSQVPVE